MANLKAKIVLRLPASEGRGWVNANGKTDPAGSYYIRYYLGSKMVNDPVKGDYHEAELALIRTERKLKAHSQGFVVPEESKPENAEKSHRIPDVITAYLTDLRENRRPEKSIKSKKSELELFAKFCDKTTVEQITRKDLIAYKNSLLDEQYAEVTVLNKLMTICIWLKKNTIISVAGLLRAEDWPEKKDTEPDPYTEAELGRMFASAGEYHLLLRFFLATGMREQEVAHAEYSDINYEKKYIQVQEKPRYNRSPKTDAGTRKIPLGDSLLADLSIRGREGLIFPNRSGNVEGHFLRIIQDIAKVAGVQGAGCHRWRDTFATDQVRAKVLDLRDFAKIMGHENMEMMKLYAAFVDLESDDARKSANASDRFASTAKPKVVKIA